MASGPTKTAVFLGSSHLDTQNLIGQLLYKCSGIDLDTIGLLEKMGRSKYDQVFSSLHEINKPASFYTKLNQVTIVTDPAARSDATVVVTRAGENLCDIDIPKFSSRRILFVIDKMWDQPDWSYEKLIDYFAGLRARLEEMTSIWIVPVELSKGDNLLEATRHRPCLLSLSHNGNLERAEFSLIDCLDQALA